MLLCSFTKKKKTLAECFPPFCLATFQHALITCCNVSRAGYNCSRAQMYHDRDTFDFSEGHETKNQPLRQSVFS